ncbi:hypothetical protein ACLB2K_068004 [Fragaria x ananassa]
MDSSSFPVPHKQFSLEIKGIKTDVVICCYDDHFLVIATQIGAMGTILQASKEEGATFNPTYSVSVIFGKRDEPMLEACARQLVEHISNSRSSRPLMLSLGLKDHSAETLKGIVAAVIENRLCLKDAVDAGMISRRWRHIWKHPILTKQNLVFDIQNIFGNQCEQLFVEYNVGMFDMNYLMDAIKQEYFVRRVNEYLKLHCGNKVESLKVAFVFD